MSLSIRAIDLIDHVSSNKVKLDNIQRLACENQTKSVIQAVGIYSLAGHLWEGRVPYYQAQVESEFIRCYAIVQGILRCMYSKKR